MNSILLKMLTTNYFFTKNKLNIYVHEQDLALNYN